MFNFIKNSSNNKTIIYVLDRLLDFSVRDWGNKNIDKNLYKILNGPEVYQEIIHMGVYPITDKNSTASSEYMNFINKLSSYITYDIRTDYLFAQTMNSQEKQEELYKNISLIRLDIIQYIFDKKLITKEIYEQEMKYKIKTLLD
jgi:hypothetical protein